ncbi:hypothetical protein [Endozoicomonas sp. ALB115]|uniref:hypothetical protein n=1 Tax=Endozoicomonas sp. ALB115 TaxID=3403074 RepID=UPI003BB7729A
MGDEKLFINDVENLQAVGEAGSATQVNSIGTNNGSVTYSTVYIQGATVPAALTDDYLSDFQKAAAREEWDDAGKVIRPLVQPESFAAYDGDRKRSIGSSYLSYCWTTSAYQEGIDWYDALSDTDKELKELSAWHSLICFLSGNEALKRQARDKIFGAILSYPDNPTIQAVAVESQEAELSQKAAENIANWLDDKDKTSNQHYHYALSSLAAYAFNQKDYALAKRAIAPLLDTQRQKVNNLKISLFALHIEINEIIKDGSVIEGVHLPIKKYKQLSAIEGKVQAIVDATNKEGYSYLDAINTLASVNALLYKPTKAIDLYEQLTLSSLPIGCIRNLLNCYQEAGDYKSALVLIESLPESDQKELAHFHTVVLFNLDEWEKASKVQPDSLPDSTIFNSESTNPLSDIEDFHYASQIAVHRYRAGGEQEKKASVEYLTSYRAADIREQLTKATSLCLCGNHKTAINIFDSIFKEVGAGFGPAFCNFMAALEKEKSRREMKLWYDQFDNGAPIESYLPLKLAHLNYIHVTQNSKKLKKAIETVLGKINDNDALPFKIYWLQVNMQQREWEMEFHKYIRKWGFRPKGHLSYRLTYLTILSHTLPPEDTLPEWYRLIHENPRRGEVLEAYQLAILNHISKNDDLQWEQHKVVSNHSAVELSDGKRILIDDDFIDISKVSEIYSSEDELAVDLIGKGVGDEISNEAIGEVTITSIYSPQLWAYRYAQTELPKRKSPGQLHQLSLPETGSDDEKVKPIFDLLKESAEAQERLEGFIIDKHLPCLTALSFRGGALKGWLHLLIKNHEKRISTSSTIDDDTANKISDLKYAVIDLTVLGSLVFLSQQNDVLRRLWGDVAVVPSITREINYEKHLAQSSGNEGMYASWDLDNDRLRLEDKTQGEKDHWINLCNEFLELTENGHITELESIPAFEFEDEDKKILECIDQTTRDTLIACHGHKDRFLVTDDANLQAFAQRFDIITVSSLQVMQLRTEDHHITKDEFSKHFVNLNTGLYLSEVTPTYVLTWLMKQDESAEYFEFVCRNLIPVPSKTQQNIEILSILMTLYLRAEDQKLGAEYILSNILSSITDDGIDIVTIIRFIKLMLKEMPENLAMKGVSCLLRLTNCKTPAGYSTAGAIEYLFEVGEMLSKADLRAMIYLKLLPRQMEKAGL